MEAKYRRILMGVDIYSDNCHTLVNAGRNLADQTGAELYLVYAVNNTYVAGLKYKLQKARHYLGELGKEFHIHQQALRLRIGLSKRIITKEATALGVDLVIMGDHQRSGLHCVNDASTARILDSSPCDVLLIRCSEKRASCSFLRQLIFSLALGNEPLTV